MKIAGQTQNPKEAWKSIKKLLGRQNKQIIINQLNIEGEILTNPEDIAEGLVINLFTYKSETTNYNLQGISSSVCSPKTTKSKFFCD